MRIIKFAFYKCILHTRSDFDSAFYILFKFLIAEVNAKKEYNQFSISYFSTSSFCSFYQEYLLFEKLAWFSIERNLRNDPRVLTRLFVWTLLPTQLMHFATVLRRKKRLLIYIVSHRTYSRGASGGVRTYVISRSMCRRTGRAHSSIPLLARSLACARKRDSRTRRRGGTSRRARRSRRRRRILRSILPATACPSDEVLSTLRLMFGRAEKLFLFPVAKRVRWDARVTHRPAEEARGTRAIRPANRCFIRDCPSQEGSRRIVRGVLAA